MNLRIKKMLKKVPAIIVFSALIFCPQLRAQDDQETGIEECCFVHPNYQGVCIVQPAEGETCEEILLYLNTPATVGKTYCENSRIRGGWERVQCPEKEEEPSGLPIPGLW